MTTMYEFVHNHLDNHPYTWLVTGAAGFIGSNLLETLLQAGQRVIGLDNFSTGKPANLAQVKDTVTKSQWQNFRFVEGDIRSLDTCRKACRQATFVLHQAALGSVPRSIEDPLTTNENNVTGFLNMLVAARASGVRRFVYASSSAVYGDHPALPKVESQIGNPLSPYAVTKYLNEQYAGVFASCYGYNSIGLRYFNVFGPRQDPDGAYATVIPRWIVGMIRKEPVFLNGDGETSRDFCYIDNVVQANLLAAMVYDPAAVNQVYNIALNDNTTLNQLFEMIRAVLEPRFPHVRSLRPIFRAFRQGDVRCSQANIDKATRLLGYRPAWRAKEGLARTIDWYVAALIQRRKANHRPSAAPARLQQEPRELANAGMGQLRVGTRVPRPADLVRSDSSES